MMSRTDHVATQLPFVVNDNRALSAGAYSQIVNHESPNLRFAGARPSRTGAGAPHPQNGGAPLPSMVHKAARGFNGLLDHRVHRALPALLRRTGLAPYLHYSHGLRIGDARFRIPIHGGLGEDLLRLTPDFKSVVVSVFTHILSDCVIDVGANIGQSVLEFFSVR